MKRDRWSLNYEAKLVHYGNQRWAQMLVGRFLKSGHLVRPNCCSKCGFVTKRISAHHDDYLLPLDIRWLCDRCHRIWHSFYGKGENLETVRIERQIPEDVLSWLGFRRVEGLYERVK